MKLFHKDSEDEPVIKEKKKRIHVEEPRIDIGDLDGSPFWLKVAQVIVDRRNLFFLLFAIGLIFSAIASGWVKVENSLSAFLPPDSETRIGIDFMEEEFVTYGTANIMVANIDYDEAIRIRGWMEETEGVAMLTFDENGDYNDFSALYTVMFAYPEEDEECLTVLSGMEKRLDSEGLDYYVSTSLIDNTSEIIATEMQRIVVLVAIVVFVVLVFTSQTYAEIPVLILTFLASALLASGTNFLLGTISFVSNSVTIVLQLALSIDYAIIFCNRYKEEHRNLPIREAAIVALSKAIPEITASSLTTIGGLVAMMFMQFLLGPDLAICLIKAILLSLLSVFLLMPGFLVLFGPLMDRTKHKNFVPHIDFVGKFAYHTRFIIPPIFVLLIIAGIILSGQCPYVYGYSSLTTPIKNDDQIVDEMMEDAFGVSNLVAVTIPKISYDKQSKLVKEYEAMPEVKSVLDLTNTEARDGYMLTDKISPRQFSELLDVDYDTAELLYIAYAYNNEDYGRIIGGINDYSVPFMDIILFAYEEIEEGYATLDDATMEELSEAYTQIMLAKNQLQGEENSRMLIYMNLPADGDETFDFLDKAHETAEKYTDGTVLVTGEATSAYDLKKTFATDNNVVSVISILAVLVVLLFTFKSAGMPVLLIVVIQGCIWLNFSYPTIMEQPLFFICYLIVSSIQMGANIDYAIVISSRYQELKDTMDKKQAMIDTLNFAFPTIITSGSIMVLAGFFIGRMTSEATIAGIGQCLFRGTLISIIAVMFVLPQILILGEKIIDKTSFAIVLPITKQDSVGVIRLDGQVHGQISGTFHGEIHGILRGEASVLTETGGFAGGGDIVDGEVSETPLIEQRDGEDEA